MLSSRQITIILKICCRQLLTLSCLLCYCYTWSQCPATTTFMEKITSIEQSSDPNTIKLRQLDSLRTLCLHCFPHKDSIYARIVHRMGNLYHLEGNWTPALTYTKEAIAVNSSGKGASTAFLANSYFNLGLFYNKLYLYPESHRYYDSCILIGTKYPEKTAIALMAAEAKAFSLYENGNYQQAIATSELGILLSRNRQDTLSEMIMLAQKAQALVAIDDTSAGATMRRALQLLPANALPAHQVTCYTIYASILGKEKQYKAALSYYQQALQVNRTQQRWNQCALNLIDIGNLWADDLKETTKAIGCYREGIGFAQKSGDPYLLAGVYNNIGTAYWKQHQYKKALDYYQQGLNTLPIHFTATNLEYNPGYVQLREAANDYFVYTLLANKGESLLALYHSTKNNSWLHAALSAFQAADMSVDLMRWKQYGEPTYLFWRNRTRKMYQQAIETCYLLQDAPAALRFFEKSRAVLLNDKLNELGARKYLSPADLAQEQELRIRTVSLQQQLDAAAPNTPAHETLYQQLLNARNALERFIRNLEKQHPAYYQYKYDTAVVTVTDIQKKLLTEGTTLLTYFTGDSSTFVLSISANSCRLLKTGFHSEEVQEFLQLCTHSSLLETQHQRYLQLAHQLYKQLFAPLQLSGHSVIISPDEYLLPFEILQSDSTNPGSYLLKQYAFSYTYAAASLLKGRQERTAGAHTLLGIAPVQYADYLQQSPLQGADQSLRRIGKNYDDMLGLYTQHASRQQFLEQLPRSSIVQLYSHASAGSADKDPVLYLSDSALYLPEIQLLHNPVTALIILSTCEGGVGRQAHGEGVLSLARGFALTGIPAIVTTLWQVDNEATYALTENFHHFLQQGMRKDVALQQAKLLFLKNNDSGRQLPYFWAASILIGDTSPIPAVTSHRNGHTFIYILAALVAISVSIFFILKKNR
ncbi:CHAT domain-containing protein [Chitinophaga flava]|uniref:CHAT domain-containing protein n=1 Tax=Chitinophaga flava TaxID=2259036 RepID=A0A365XTC5_9BACT|nr:CHAT domain-containing protein [Chitinophaga flava]RBL89368.1 hypothetical protein DF182_22875 [Chitinophaga flava]